MKKAAFIVWKVERVFAIIGLISAIVCTVVLTVYGMLGLDMLFKVVQERPEQLPVWLKWLADADTKVAFIAGYWAFTATFGLLLIGFSIVEMVVCNIAVKKMATATNKNDMITLSVLNCIFGWKVPGIFVFVSRTHEWNNVEEKPEY